MKSFRGFGAELRGIFSWRLVAIVAVVVVIALIFQSQSDGSFLTPRNLSLLLRQAAVVSVVACGVAMLIIMSEIDLSIGSAIYLVGVIATTSQAMFGADPLIAVLLAMATGLVLGAWQGFWVAVIGVPSFVVTLGGLLAFRGVGLVLTDAKTIAPLPDAYVLLSEGFVPAIPTVAMGVVLLAASWIFLANAARKSTRVTGSRQPWGGAAVKAVIALIAIAGFVWLMVGHRGMPNAIIWVLIVAGVLWFVMSRTVFGRNAYMIGSNRPAARLAGIRVKRNIFFGFVLMGLLYGVGGVLITARLSASTASDGEFVELDAIAAAVIGGVALAGGVGRIPAVVGGALLLAMIDNGMSIVGVSSFAQLIVKAMILTVAVALDVWLRNGRARLPRLRRRAPEAAPVTESQES